MVVECFVPSMNMVGLCLIMIDFGEELEIPYGEGRSRDEGGNG